MTITSSSGIFGTGEKKCMPTTCVASRDASAMRAIGIVLVFEATIASWERGFDIADDRLFDGEILEHRLDHQRHVAKARVVAGARTRATSDRRTPAA